MSDDFEGLLRRWLRDRAGNDRSAVEALAVNVAALPPRRTRWPSGLLGAAASIVVVIGLVALVALRLGGVGNEARSTPAQATQGSSLPGGPAAFAGDPRLEQCSGTPADMEFVFEMTHARDYQRYLPRMGLSPELDVEETAIAVIYRDGWAGVATSGGLGAAPATPTPGRRFVCVLVAGGDPNMYSDVDIDGLTIAVTPSGTSSPTATADPTVPASLVMTPEPAPAWVADLAGQLECDGPVANLGSEYPEAFGRPDPLGDDPESALGLFLGPGNMFASLPTGGFTQLHAEPHWASFVHVVDGRPKAIIVMTDTTEFGAVWSVVALRACDASEFDPAVPLTFPVTIWKDVSGNAVSTESIRSNPGPGHCGWDSAIWLHVGGELYFRDPQGVIGEWTKTRFEARAQLPTSATDSGYRSGDWSLWLDAGKDAYMVSSGNVERWPRSLNPQLACQ